MYVLLDSFGSLWRSSSTNLKPKTHLHEGRFIAELFRLHLDVPAKYYNNYTANQV